MRMRTTTTRLRRRSAAAPALLAAAVALLATACGPDWEPRSERTSGTRLVAPESCEELVDLSRDGLEDWVDARWSTDGDAGADGALAEESMADSAAGSQGAVTTLTPVAPAAGAAERADGADGATRTTGGEVVAGTNVAESGVDEGDLLKTDGRRLVSVVDGILRVTVLDGSPAVDGTLDLRADGASELFLRGDRALVIGGGSGWSGGWSGDGVPPVARPDGPEVGGPTAVPGTAAETGGDLIDPAEPRPFATGVTLTLVDLSDPAAPTVLDSVEVEGSLVASRSVDGTARIVVRSQPVVMDDVAMATDAGAAREAVAAVGARDLMPRVADESGSIRSAGGCRDVLLTPTGSSSGVTPVDYGTVTVLSVGDDLADLHPVTVAGGAETVYASSERLYVTSTTWDEHGSSTAVHRFDLTGDGPAAYSGSGRAPGTLLNHYSLSEAGEDLRLVTTTEGSGTVVPIDGVPEGGTEPAAAPDAVAEALPVSAGRLTVLRPGEDGGLEEVGHLDGLGVGETVRSVRFLGDTAYVVTFRRTDPLFAIDLSDPTSPELLGQLKIPGFSEYLHPVGDGLLLGVGREVDADTLEDRGLKLSLFDVSDPAAPRETDQVVLPAAWSPVGSDPHAFTWDPRRDQAVIALEGSCGPTADCSAPASAMALVVGVDGDELADRGRVVHQGSDTMLRSVVVDDTLWTLSRRAFGSSPANSPADVTLTPF